MRLLHLTALTAAVVASSLSHVAAQSLTDYEGDTYHFEGCLLGGINSDGWEWDMGVSWFPIANIGIKAAIGLAGEPVPVYEWGDDDYGWYDSGSEYDTRLRFTTAMVLRTPRIIEWRSQSASFHLFAEPGIVLSPGLSGSHHARIACWDVKSGVNVAFGRLVFALGYEISSFTLYSGAPDIDAAGHPLPEDRYRQSVFASVGYKF